MNSIVLSAYADANSVQYEYGSDNQITKAIVPLTLTMTAGKDNQSVQVSATAILSNGQAKSLAIPSDGYVTVMGQAAFVKQDCNTRRMNLVIHYATITPGHMSANVNVISIVGRLGQEPETMRFESGAVRTTFSVAVNRSKEVSDWFKVEAWSNQATTAEKFLRKGHNVALTGALKYETWTDKTTGESAWDWRLNVSRLTLVEKKSAPTESAPASGYDDFDADF